MPGMKLRNVLVQNVTRVASADVSDDLPVNPLLAILYTLRFQQAAASDTADKQVGLADILAVVSRIEVLYRGTTVISGSLADIMMMNAILTGRVPYIINQGDAANGPRSVTIPIYLGRLGAQGREAFPASRRGELTLRRLFAAAFTRVDTADLDEQIETVELLGAEPAAFLKYVTLSKTFVTTGDNDMDLPLGNPILGALLFGTTGFNATTSVATWKQVKLLVDNVEWQYALSNWETLNGELRQLLGAGDHLQQHTHTENLAAAYAADVATAKARNDAGLLPNYAWLDLDMFGDASMALETVGRGRVHLRATAGTADAARALALEVVQLGGAAAA